MRTVFISGSSRGIGFGMAKAFAARGERVILNARQDGAQLQKAAAALQAESFLADMGDYAQAREVFAKLGEVDVLVNNAGTAHFGLFTDMTSEDIERVLYDNLLSVLNATHLAVPGMVRRKRGVVINISSIWGVAGASCEAVYAAAKAGVNGFTKSMAKELGPSGIRVNAIACGAVDTRMNERLSQAERDAFTEGIPLGRFGTAEEVGALAYFLASDEAAYLTGQVVVLDGGVL